MTSADNDDTRWKFVASPTAGLWHIQRAAGGASPRLRSDKSVNPDMQATSSVGVNTQFELSESPAIEGAYLLTLPNATTTLQRFRISPEGVLDFAETSSVRKWPSLRISVAE